MVWLTHCLAQRTLGIQNNIIVLALKLHIKGRETD